MVAPTGSEIVPLEVRLKEDEETRLECPASEEVVLELLEGTAEIFGTELVQNKRYTFSPGSRTAIFSWHGCTLEMVGGPIFSSQQHKYCYTAKSTPMVIYLNTHAALEQLRQHAESNAVDGAEVRGPRIMIVGPTDVGKSTVCRILLNYAVKKGRTPTYVDLDVGQGSISVPGTISALHVERPADPIEGFDKNNCLVYHFGHLSPGENLSLFDTLVSNLADKINQKCKVNADVNFGGVIINTCGWVKGEGYTSLVKAAEYFEVDVVVVLDHERLYNELQRDLPSIVKIVHQPKSGGVEDRSREMRALSRQNKVREYFYGIGKSRFNPHLIELSFDEIKLCKIGAAALPDSCLPLGTKEEDHNIKVVSMPVTPVIVHHILAVSSCGSTSEDVLRKNTAGFICVQTVDMEERRLTALSPQPYPLPTPILVYSEVTYMDDLQK